MSAPASAVPRALERDERFPTTSDGWALQLTRFVDRAAFRPELAPIVLVPGYGMNSFILGFHPGGTSLVHALCASGREVWCADLRGQGRSHRVDSGAPPPSLRRLAERDLPALDHLGEDAEVLGLAQRGQQGQRLDVAPNGEILGVSLVLGDVICTPIAVFARLERGGLH